MNGETRTKTELSVDTLRAIVESVPEAFILLSRDGRVLYRSPSTDRITGRSGEEEVGHLWTEHVHTDDLPHLQDTFQRLVAGEMKTHSDTARARHADGTWRLLEVTGTNLLDIPAIQAVVVVVRDVTDRSDQAWRRDVVLSIARRFAAETSAQVVLETLLEEARTLFGVEHGVVHRYDERSGVRYPVVTTFPAHAEGPREDRPGASQIALRERRPVVIYDYSGAVHPDSPSVRTVCARAGIASPLLYEGRLLGCITLLTTSHLRVFSAEDLVSLELLSGLAAAALVGMERARLAGVLLAARTLEHELNNQLALTVGYAELLSRDPRLHPELRSHAEEALRGALAAAGTLGRLQSLTYLDDSPDSDDGLSVIDLRRSETSD
jgi:PAS domain S-box-containing protein